MVGSRSEVIISTSDCNSTSDVINVMSKINNLSRKKHILIIDNHKYLITIAELVKFIKVPLHLQFGDNMNGPLTVLNYIQRGALLNIIVNTPHVMSLKFINISTKGNIYENIINELKNRSITDLNIYGVTLCEATQLALSNMKSKKTAPSSSHRHTHTHTHTQ
eukprot:GHVR01115028.1.p1 GENE.GHVR01115028.1~~GHVR01115028.1.p1  ORF type:complete len:163 (+),score=40.46 GHVR01115028.1:49-537(+)